MGKIDELLRAQRAGNSSLAGNTVDKLPPLAAVTAVANQQNKDADNNAIRNVVASMGNVAMDQHGKLTLCLELAGRYGAMPMESQRVADLIQAKAAAIGKTISKEKRNSEIERLRGQALLDNNRVTTHVRVAAIGGRYHLDLGNGNMVTLSPGSWEEEKNTHVNFRFTDGELPSPVKPDSVTRGYAYICDFLRRAGLPDYMHVIVLAVVIEWLRPDTAHPILDIVGPSGGGKTTLALMLINLIDPATDWKVGETQLDEEHIAAAAYIRHVLLLDNQNGMSQERQNLACRVVYGTVLMARELYSQNSVHQSKVHSPILIASINPAITNPDALARAVRAPFNQRTGGYVSEQEIRKRYVADRPAVLGAVLEIFSQALALLPEVIGQRVWKQRLVDFAQMGEAVVQVLGMPPGTFVTALNSMREGVANDIVEGDGFVTAIMDFITMAGAKAAESDRFPSYKSWATKSGWASVKHEGTIKVAVKPNALLEHVKQVATTTSINYTHVQKWCPETPRAMTSTLTIKLPLLADLGIKAANKPDFGGKKNGAWVFAFKASDHAQR